MTKDTKVIIFIGAAFLIVSLLLGSIQSGNKKQED